jgi:hypothetical protein
VHRFVNLTSLTCVRVRITSERLMRVKDLRQLEVLALDKCSLSVMEAVRLPIPSVSLIKHVDFVNMQSWTSLFDPRALVSLHLSSVVSFSDVHSLPTLERLSSLTIDLHPSAPLSWLPFLTRCPGLQSLVITPPKRAPRRFPPPPLPSELLAYGLHSMPRTSLRYFSGPDIYAPFFAMTSWRSTLSMLVSARLYSTKRQTSERILCGVLVELAAIAPKIQALELRNVFMTTTVLNLIGDGFGGLRHLKIVLRKEATRLTSPEVKSSELVVT